MKRIVLLMMAFVLTTSVVRAGEEWQASWIGVSETAAADYSDHDLPPALASQVDNRFADNERR